MQHLVCPATQSCLLFLLLPDFFFAVLLFFLLVLVLCKTTINSGTQCNNNLFFFFIIIIIILRILPAYTTCPSKACRCVLVIYHTHLYRYRYLQHEIAIFSSVSARLFSRNLNNIQQTKKKKRQKLSIVSNSDT